MKKIIYIVLVSMFLFPASAFSAQFNSDALVPKDEVIIAYKNDSREVLVIKALHHQVKIKSISIFDILGTQVAHLSSNTSIMEVDLSRLRAGKYLISYTLSDNTHKVKQIIKQ